MRNNFDISDIESLVSAEVRKLGLTNVWNNRPKAIDEATSDFVVVKVTGGIFDKEAYGHCRVVLYLYARDIKEKKNSKKLSVMQGKLKDLPLWIEPLLLTGNPRIVGDTADDFGFHVRLINYKAFIKSK